VHPARQRYLLATMFEAQLAAAVGPKHSKVSWRKWPAIVAWNPRFSNGRGVIQQDAAGECGTLHAPGVNSRLPGETAV
jgi:hypothetical protein